MEEPKVIYEDKNFLAVYKPAGLLVHETRNTKHETLKWDKQQNVSSFTSHVSVKEATLVDWLLKRYPEVADVGDDPEARPGIVHRLDRDTSGVMLVARNQKYFDYLKSLFQKREIKKTYLALVWGVPKEKEGTIDKPLGIKNGTTKRSVHSEKMAKDAITEYRLLKNFQFSTANFQKTDASLLEVMPKTGRTHQIRAHLASIGHPIVGDKLYGGKKPAVGGQWSNVRLMLHALALEFEAEPGKRIRIEAEPPAELTEFGNPKNTLCRRF